MTERGILFSAPMVRKLLAGEKTQTRRLVNPASWDPHGLALNAVLAHGGKLGVQAYFGQESWGVRCPYGMVGDRLWVRETFYCDHVWAGSKGTVEEWLAMTYYRADYESEAAWSQAEEWAERTPAWRPSIHMPRWASRILLDVTEVRVQRLQEITRQDAIAEGVPLSIPAELCADPVAEFGNLWDCINEDRCPWKANPWVWAVSFKLVEVRRG